MASRLEEVRRILDEAADRGRPGHPDHLAPDGRKLGRFWNLPLQEFVNAVVYGMPVIVWRHPEKSAMIAALKGDPPFDGSGKFVRTRRHRHRPRRALPPGNAIWPEWVDRCAVRSVKSTVGCSRNTIGTSTAARARAGGP